MGPGVIDQQDVFIADRYPDFFPAWGKFHVQDAFARGQGLDQFFAFHVDNLDRVIAGNRKIDPDLAAIGARHHKHRAAHEIGRAHV